MKADINKRPRRPAVPYEALDETLRLYGGWLSYLLGRLGESVVRVEADELRHALETLSCRVEKEGSAYVIHMEHAGDSAKGGDTDGGQESEENRDGRDGRAD